MDATASLNAALAGRYEILREAGQGGMATVYLARDVRHDRQVALKVLHPDLAAALGAERFLAEIKTTANLQHPHILPLHDSGEAPRDGAERGGPAFLYYVMPFVTGETLRTRLDREAQLPIDDALRIAREVLSALDYAHRHGVIHRDIKPENILLHDGSALVADFGIALAVTAAGGQRMTQTGLSLGTPQYMSPEQAMGERQIDGRADVYATAAVLYEMLTGDPPFTGSTVQAIVAKVMTERPTPPRIMRDTIPPQVEQATLRGLSKLPADRFATAAQFADALGGAPASAAYGTDSAATPAPTRHAVRRHRIAIAIIAATAAAAAIVGTVWMASHRSVGAPLAAERFVLPLSVEPLPDQRAMGAYVGSALAISPNGSRIVYVGRDSLGVLGLWVRQLELIDPRRIAGSEGAQAVTMSPDGKSVAYVANGQVRTISLEGGSAVTIVSNGARSAHWAADGMVYYRSVANPGQNILMRIPSAGGRSDTVSRRSLYDVEMLPGGKALIARRAGRPGTPGHIVAMALSDTTVRDLGEGERPTYTFSRHLVYIGADGVLMTMPFDASRLRATGPPTPMPEPRMNVGERISQYALSRSGALVYVTGAEATREVVWVTRTGAATLVDSSLRAALSDPVLSPDGRRLAYVLDQTLWVKQLDHGASLKLATDSLPYGPAWTPDGQFISYARRTAQVHYALWKVPVESGGPAVEIMARGAPVESAWSADGKWLVYRSATNTAGAGDLFAIRLGVDSAPVSIAASAANEWQPALSPDGKYIAYASNESGGFEIYVAPFPAVQSRRWVVSTHGGSEPLWSHAGTELFYRDGSDNLVSVDVKTTPTFSAGGSRTLFPAAGYATYPGHRQYDVSRDDQRFLMLRTATGVQPRRVVFVRNWGAQMGIGSRE